MTICIYCVPDICKRRHKPKRYRDGHTFGRKYAMSNLPGDNNGNGPSKNLLSVRFGMDIGGVKYGDNDFKDDDHSVISTTDHTTFERHAFAIAHRHNVDPRVLTSVRHSLTS